MMFYFYSLSHRNFLRTCSFIFILNLLQRQSSVLAMTRARSGCWQLGLGRHIIFCEEIQIYIRMFASGQLRRQQRRQQKANESISRSANMKINETRGYIWKCKKNNNNNKNSRVYVLFHIFKYERACSG